MSVELKPCPFCGSTNVELRKGMFWNGLCRIGKVVAWMPIEPPKEEEHGN